MIAHWSYAGALSWAIQQTEETGIDRVVYALRVGGAVHSTEGDAPPGAVVLARTEHAGRGRAANVREY